MIEIFNKTKDKNEACKITTVDSLICKYPIYPFSLNPEKQNYSSGFWFAPDWAGHCGSSPCHTPSPAWRGVPRLRGHPRGLRGHPRRQRRTRYELHCCARGERFPGTDAGNQEGCAVGSRVTATPVAAGPLPGLVGSRKSSTVIPCGPRL